MIRLSPRRARRRSERRRWRRRVATPHAHGALLGLERHCAARSSEDEAAVARRGIENAHSLASQPCHFLQRIFEVGRRVHGLRRARKHRHEERLVQPRGAGACNGLHRIWRKLAPAHPTAQRALSSRTRAPVRAGGELGQRPLQQSFSRTVTLTLFGRTTRHGRLLVCRATDRKAASGPQQSTTLSCAAAAAACCRACCRACRLHHPTPAVVHAR